MPRRDTLQRFFRGPGPGLITGAADDDPSGISTYSVAGAAYGYATLWTAKAWRFYAVIAVAMLIGLALDFAGLNAVKMLFWSAVLNGVLAPPLVVLVVMLTSDQRVMGKRVNSAWMRWLGWICAGAMGVAAVAMFAL